MSRSLAVVSALWLVGILSMAAPRNVGDASEYVAMAANLAAGRPPALSDADFAHLGEAFAHQPGGFELQTRRLPELRGADGRYDMPHMWLYPLLAVPGVWLAQGLALPPVWGLVALNTLLVAALAGLALRRGAGPWTLALFATPLVWWIDKPLADLWIAVCLGAAVLLWPTRGPLSLVVLGFAAAQNPALILSWAAFVVAAIVGDPARRRDPRWWAGAGIGAVAAALAPAYYLWHLGRASPLTTYVGATWPSLPTLLFPLTDVNMGALIRFPPGALLVGLALVRREGWRGGAAWPAAVTAVLLLAAISQQPNMNQGGNPDFSRYALWLLPLTLPWLLAADLTSGRQTQRLGAILLVLCAAWTLFAFRPSRPESYRYPTPLAAWVWARHPSWTAPRPEAFAERTSHREPGLVPTATPGCEKVLLFEGRWPASCPPAEPDVPPSCREPGAFCYADAITSTAHAVTPAGPRGWLGPDVHGRTWLAGHPAATWLSALVAGLRTDDRTDAVASVRGAWQVDWTQTWRGDDRVVVYARDSVEGAHLALRHSGQARIQVRTPAGLIDTIDVAPAEAPTIVPLPAGPHVVVDVRVK